MEYKNTVTLLGTRGSMPCSGKEYLRYGGRTTCILVQLAGETLLLDGGSGMAFLKAESVPVRRLSILLTHAHVDHLLGLPMSPILAEKDVTVDLYAATRDGRSGEQQVRALMQPPLWPVEPEALPATICFHDLPTSLDIGAVHVDTMAGVHPGGVTVYRVSGAGKSVVLATDCTFTEDLLPSLREFSKGCDLLLCDGQYSEEEWADRSAFGHSTWLAAAKLGRDCGAKQVRIIHHAPDRTDDELDAAAAVVSALCPNCRFGYDEEVITL